MSFGIDILQTIGAALGVPLSIALCVIVMTLKSHNDRLNDGDARMTKIEGKHQESEALLQEIRANVAFIKGRLEKD